MDLYNETSASNLNKPIEEDPLEASKESLKTGEAVADRLEKEAEERVRGSGGEGRVRARLRGRGFKGRPEERVGGGRSAGKGGGEEGEWVGGRVRGGGGISQE